MKITVEIADGLLARARRHARKANSTVRALIEEGLRRVLDEKPGTGGYKMPDRSAGRAGDPDPIERMSWDRLRDEVYGDR